jgi:acetyl/propionyl-CoA carboxylase alpha subunit
LSAIRKLDYALSKLQFLGMRNNIGFLRRVLMHEVHLAGQISTQFIEEHEELLIPDSTEPPLAIIAAAMARQGIGYWRNYPNRRIRHQFRTEYDIVELNLIPQRNGDTLVKIADTEYHVQVQGTEHGQYTVTVDGHRQKVVVVQNVADICWVHTTGGMYRLQWLTPLPIPATQAETHGSLRAPMPGQVIAIHVEVGQVVKKGDVLLILEAMKMEHRIEAPYNGIVESIEYNQGDSVQQDAVLLALASHREED